MSILSGGSSSVDNLDDNGKVGGRFLDDESRVSSSDKGSLEELMDFSLEDSVSDELSSFGEALADFKVRVVDWHAL